MSTGKRLAKRSIIGTRVCALGEDQLYHPGVINAVRTTAAPAGSGPGENRYSVRFDCSSPQRRGSGVVAREYRDSEIVGPGFRSVTNVRLRPGQKVFLTHNGREVAGRVLEVGEWEGEEADLEGGEELVEEGEEEEEYEEDTVAPEEAAPGGGPLRVRKRAGRMVRSRGRRPFPHSPNAATTAPAPLPSQAGVEVVVAILTPGHDAPLELRKRQEEVRLLESRKSARLMDHDTDFARLADMVAGDRRRTSSHSIDVPSGPPGSSSSSSSSSSSASSSASSNSLNSHHSGVSRKRRPSEGWGGVDDAWADDAGLPPDECMDECTAALVLMRLSCSPHSPHRFERFPWGEQLSPCSSDAALGSSWQSGTGGGRRSTPSPPLSSDGSVAAYTNGRWSTLNTTDEGIVIDEFEELPKKKKPMSRMVFQCTWPGCQFVTTTCTTIEQHVRNSHLGPRQNADDPELSDDHEEEFYYTEVELAEASSCPRGPGSGQGKKVSGSGKGGIDGRIKLDSGTVSPTNIPIASPPTLSHRDMARPPHEDPEYQRQLHSAAALRHNHQVAGPITIPAETIMWSSPPTITSPASPQKYLKLSPKPSGLSPSRKVRGETKKCRKVYGMEHRELWCTQCKWKKACSRFGD
ncbi:zinc finger protein 704 [Ischnura elegans]|uniref:zinc finger protein 704 n=1 Tax=Ischnura elegans TaxID=197161 RepID=UPI001ED8B873|nr:zinc finger protein 704 [Ischnura elegans]